MSIANPAHSSFPRTRAGFVAVAVTVVFAVLTELDFRGASLVWINLFWLSSACVALSISLHGLKDVHGDVRASRLAFVLSFGIFLFAQVVWVVQVAIGWPVVPGPSDFLFVLAPLPAFWAVLVGVRECSFASAASTAKFDSFTMLLAIVVAILSTLGRTPLGRDEAILLLYPILYFAPAGAAIVGALASHERLRPKGVWLIVLGACVLGGSFAVWTSRSLDGESSIGTTVDYLFGAGALVLGFGAATWAREPETNERRRQVLEMFSEFLPLAAILGSICLALVAYYIGDANPALGPLIVGMLAVNGVRQVVLIRSERRSQSSLRALAGELSTTEYRERRKIATYLHDCVGQAIAVLSMKLGMLRITDDKEPIEREIDEIVKQLADDMRLTTFELSPPTLYELGLGPAVERLAEEFSGRYAVEITVDDRLTDQPLDEDTLPLLYRFIRELLMNVIKHAEATRAAVRIMHQGDDVLIEVEDDGRGIELPLDTEGFGLYSIQERASAMGIGFDIRPRQNGGTLATVVAPTG